MYKAIDKYIKRRKKEKKTKFSNFTNATSVISVKDFFELKACQQGDIVGVYVIYNENKNMYYVGQAKNYFLESINILRDMVMVMYMLTIKLVTVLR